MVYAVMGCKKRDVSAGEPNMHASLSSIPALRYLMHCPRRLADILCCMQPSERVLALETVRYGRVSTRLFPAE